MYLIDDKFILSALSKLTTDAQPIFGKMTPQHMVEHLAFSLMFSNGKMPQALLVAEDTAAKIKEKIIDLDQEIPIGYKAPMLKDDLPKLHFPSLDAAIQKLMTEWNDYNAYKQSYLYKISIHPTMGVLSYKEWDIFHSKHFKHHFKQFELL